MKTLILSALISLSASAQDMDVVGSLKVGQMPTDNATTKIVVHKADGKLGTRDLNSLAAAPADTSRSLGSDLEIFKSFCSCPPENMPPSMVKKLLDSGYSEEDLSLMGVSQKQIRRSKPVVDADGNIYEVMKIITELGESFVLKDNLRTTRFNDGTIIIGNIPPSGWINARDNAIPAWAYPDYNPSNVNIYGLLYNGHALSSGKNPCPLGWKPITYIELNDLFPNNAEELRAQGTDTWNFPNTGNNFSGLNLPGAGGIEIDGTAVGFRTTTVLHSSEVNVPSNQIYSTVVLKDSQLLSSGQYPKGYGGSVRCYSDTW